MGGGWKTHKGHNLLHSTLNLKALDTLHPDHVALGCEWWEHDVGAIVLHDLAHLFHPAKQDSVDLGRRRHGILQEQLRSANQLVDLALGQLNVLGILSGDVNLVLIPALGSRGAVSVRLRKWWEVDGRVRCRLNKLDVLPRSTAHNGVQCALNAHCVDISSELTRFHVSKSCKSLPQRVLMWPLTNLSMKMSTWVLACSEVSVSPKIATRHLWSRMTSTSPLRPSTTGVSFGPRIKMSTPQNLAKVSRASVTCLTSMPPLASTIRPYSTSTVVQRCKQLLVRYVSSSRVLLRT